MRGRWLGCRGKRPHARIPDPGGGGGGATGTRAAREGVRASSRTLFSRIPAERLVARFPGSKNLDYENEYERDYESWFRLPTVRLDGMTDLGLVPPGGLRLSP